MENSNYIIANLPIETENILIEFIMNLYALKNVSKTCKELLTVTTFIVINGATIDSDIVNATKLLNSSAKYYYVDYICGDLYYNGSKIGFNTFLLKIVSDYYGPQVKCEFRNKFHHDDMLRGISTIEVDSGYKYVDILKSLFPNVKIVLKS